ncbi:hypothetical protein JW933_09830 [candidate division FCPU426 bacterium]|nr:hypothetical protein [candidate division FCPU426 bacterium]
MKRLFFGCAVALAMFQLAGCSQHSPTAPESTLSANEPAYEQTLFNFPAGHVAFLAKNTAPNRREFFQRNLGLSGAIEGDKIMKTPTAYTA